MLSRYLQAITFFALTAASLGTPMDDISYHSNNIQESIGHLRSVVVSSNKISDLISIESAASGLDSAITEGETALSKHSTLSEDDCATLRNTALETYHTSVPSIEMLPKLIKKFWVPVLKTVLQAKTAQRGGHAAGFLEKIQTACPISGTDPLGVAITDMQKRFQSVSSAFNGN